MKRVMVINVPPVHCPHCGERINLAGYQAFFAGLSFVCNCGLRFQYASTRDILNAATGSGGDLEYYHDFDITARLQSILDYKRVK